MCVIKCDKCYFWERTKMDYNIGWCQAKGTMKHTTHIATQCVFFRSTTEIMAIPSG